MRYKYDVSAIELGFLNQLVTNAIVNSSGERKINNY
jgi:hypothetical protein